MYNRGMIILSAGMPRAGSGWYFNLTNDLMLAHGARDARQIRERYRLQAILTEVNCNIGALTTRRTLRVLLPAALGNTFVIKAHAAPGALARRAIGWGWMRPTYIYRDPRDALLSAMENGQRALERGRPNAFAPYAEFEAALDFMRGYLRTWEAWMRCDRVLLARYEDLLLNYEAEAERLVAFLGLDPADQQTRQLVAHYQPEKGQEGQKGLHFSHGKIGRFRHKLTPDQQEKMNQSLSPFLAKMGYAI